jgi:hypothetical protein
MLGRIALLSLVILVVACNGGSSAKTCPTGTLRCECYRNKTCNAGLSCYSDRCVESAAGFDADIHSSGGASGVDAGADSSLSVGGASGLGGAIGTGGSGALDAAGGGTLGAGGGSGNGGVAVIGVGGAGGGAAIDAGRGGVPGFGGTVGTGGKLATGGAPGSGGAVVGSGGLVGTGGKPGTGGHVTGGSGGSGTYQVTFNLGSPVYRTVGHGLFVGTTSQNEGVVVGAIGAGPAQSADPGPTIRWYPNKSLPVVKREVSFPLAPTPSAVAVAPDDSLWLVGSLYDRSASFGGPTIAKSDMNYYLAHLAADGTHLFTTAVSAAQMVWLDAVTTDADGNVYVAGELVSSDYATSSVFVRKLGTDGITVFERAFSGTGPVSVVKDIAVSSSGSIAITGQIQGSVAFGATTVTSKTTSAGKVVGNGFVAVLSASDGAPSMARIFGGSMEDVGYAVQMTGTGALRVGGYITGTGEVGGKAVSSSATEVTPFIAELDASTGAASWVRVLGGDGVVFDSVTDAAGRTFAVGRFEGPGTGPGRTSGSSSFVSLVQPDGTSKVIMQTLTNGNGAMHAALDASGGLWIGGEYMGSANFGLGTIVPTGTVGVLDYADYAVYLKPM